MEAALPTKRSTADVARKIAADIRAAINEDIVTSLDEWALQMEVLADRIERENEQAAIVSVPPVERGFTVEWDEIDPKIAAEEGLTCVPCSPVIGPINEIGEECPWPWEPQQLAGAPLGQFHCGYCGGMQIAGMSHSDWSMDGYDPANNVMPAEFHHPRRPNG